MTVVTDLEKAKENLVSVFIELSRNYDAEINFEERQILVNKCEEISKEIERIRDLITEQGVNCLTLSQEISIRNDNNGV